MDGEECATGYELFHTAHMSVTERLIACLKNETMTDVVLVGDDGIPVPACRYILGSASAVMQPLLYGNLSEQSRSVTIRGANQKPLVALVEFCCSDELNTSIWAESHPLEIVQDSLALAKLADTFEIPRLQLKLRDFLKPLMDAYPPLACSVFNLADANATPEIYKCSLELIQEQAMVALKSPTASKSSNCTAIGGIVCFSPEKLEDVLSNNDVEADELFLFQQLVQWRDYNQRIFSTRKANAICKAMVKHIDLSCIPPQEIETTVMQSGFVDASMLVQALMVQAKSASNEGLAMASMRGPRGRKHAHIMVENAGDDAVNGVYVHVTVSQQHQSSDPSPRLTYYVKKPTNHSDSSSTTSSQNARRMAMTHVLVQDSVGTWRICDSNKSILYEWQRSGKSQHHRQDDGFPHHGWLCIAGASPAPKCRWLRAGAAAASSDNDEPTTNVTPSTASSVQTATSTSSMSASVTAPLPAVAAAALADVLAASRNNDIASSATTSNSQESKQNGPTHIFPLPEEKQKEPANAPTNNKPPKPSSSASLLSPEAQAHLKHMQQPKNVGDISITSANPVMVGAKTKTQTSNWNKPGTLTVIGNTTVHKTAKNEGKKEKRKAKVESRKTALVDDFDEEVDPSNDPILGFTIGGDGFMPEEKLHADNNSVISGGVLHHHKRGDFSGLVKLPEKNIPIGSSCSIQHLDDTDAALSNHVSSIGPGCILPSRNGEPVVVGCSTGNTSVTDMFFCKTDPK